MVQYRALVIVLILLLSSTVPEVHSKSIFERDRRDWMVTVDAVAAYIYEVVNKVSPRAGQFLMDVSQTAAVAGTRNFLISETARLSMLAEQLIEKIKKLWYTKVLGY
ncbi:apovitellenin-1-like [Numida meleagris]|uniref:apovitellenin-1-like n=1 Tax=Numida meleagris TaxID=8996 RepID=UPI000B3DEE60|nr:apovitellenin-1-like [Numida meleagris]